MRVPEGDLQIHAPATPHAVGQRLAIRVVMIVMLWIVAWVVTDVRELHPDPLRLLMVVAVIGAMGWLLVDAVVEQAPGWRHERPDPHDWLGHDPRTGAYVQLIENHLAERDREAVLREQLLDLAADVVRARHGAGADLRSVDPQLAAELNRRGRLDMARIDTVVTRIGKL